MSLKKPSRIKKLIYTVLFFVALTGKAQNPFHFRLGSDELAGIDVYGINQTPDGVYWFTTNRGLFSFDGYAFKNYQSPLQLSASLFNPKIDYDGNIYCNNLNGQIFSVKNDSLELFHSNPSIGKYPNYNFLTDNSLYIRGYQQYRLVNNKELDKKYILTNSNTTVAITKDCNNNLLTHIGTDSLFRINSHATEEFKLIGLEMTDREALSFFCHKNELIAVSTEGQLFSAKQISPSEIELSKIFKPEGNISRVYKTSNNVWFADRILGVSYYNIESSTLKSIFLKQFISYVFEDTDGNILLGTFGDGIIVIPKVNIENDLLPNIDITHFSIGKNGELFSADKEGNVYISKGDKTRKIFKSRSSRIELLEYYPLTDKLYIEAEKFIEYNAAKNETMKYNFGSTKSIYPIDKNKILLYSTFGIILKEDSIYSILNTDIERGNSLAYKDSLTLYVGSQRGLKDINLETGISRDIKYEQKNIVAKKLAFLDTTLLVASSKDGILKLNGGTLNNFIDKGSGLLSRNINQMKTYNDTIYVATSKGLQVFNPLGKLIGSVGISDGLSSTHIKNFHLHKKQLYLLHSEGIQKIALKDIFINEKNKLSIKNIDIIVDNEYADYQEIFSLPSSTNQLAFKIYAPSLAKSDDLSYDYKLSGIDDDWKNQSYNENIIEYKRLPPGKYEFEVILRLKGVKQDVRPIGFIIEKPYWQTIWFISLSICLIVTISYLFFRFRIRRLAEKALQLKELNEAKLQALQSQLDPHFVFNALNCLQNMVLDGNVIKTNDYLVKFANLMRTVLEHSRKKFILLKQEIDVVKTYLELQEIYYKNSFSYQINIDPNIDQETFMLPPMLIQPFLENALEHGILGNAGLITLDFELRKDFINIKITDNGVGLSEAKKRKNEEHKSIGTDIIRERISNYNEKYLTNLKLLIYELKDDNERVIGTRVELNIPYEIAF
ncbi:histidine kinase [Marivirga arenosa]|uniref:Histidine kinase n=1 Tax=Marivirga arenosa TaxID=3059076 RepID=A0AA51N7C9_9BACT|nr:histidine kinase [Marivirga sp. ABR2-2]WMN07509.1 histidine kinase [Marivirga sp. ABR2-2]